VKKNEVSNAETVHRLAIAEAWGSGAAFVNWNCGCRDRAAALAQLELRLLGLGVRLAPGRRVGDLLLTVGGELVRETSWPRRAASALVRQRLLLTVVMTGLLVAIAPELSVARAVSV
jgi:hypothetical protein